MKISIGQNVQVLTYGINNWNNAIYEGFRSSDNGSNEVHYFKGATGTYLVTKDTLNERVKTN